jgi:K+-sensing histidine kinase KdpD
MLPDFRVRQRDYLLEISRAITQELDLDKLLERILSISLEMLAGQAGLIALRSPQGGWNVRVSTGLPQPFLKYLEPQLEQIPEYEDPEDSELYIINRLLNTFTQAVSLGRLSSVGLPLITGQKVIGVIFVFREYSQFSGNDRKLLSSFANQTAIAVQNAQLYTQVDNDRRKFSALLDSAGDGILILDKGLKIERANPAFGFLYGMTAESFTGLAHEDVIKWQKRPQGVTLEDSVASGWPLAEHSTLYVEGDLDRGRDNPSLPVGITYAALLSKEGHLLNIITTVRDITRFRQAEEMKSTFVSVVSHELKTPVALIKGYVGTLRRDDARWDRKIIDESLQVIEEEADRLSIYIENLLDATRLQANGFSIKKNDVQIAELIHHVVERLQTQTQKHTLTEDIPVPLPVILADETRLNQLLSNLVNNAIKYSTEGRITISARLHGENIIICVSDGGRGIDPNDAPFVFDRFYRASEAVKKTKGAGLGLYLSKAIVEAHGGQIWIDPEYHQGARICFCLPISTEQ